MSFAERKRRYRGRVGWIDVKVFGFAKAGTARGESRLPPRLDWHPLRLQALGAFDRELAKFVWSEGDMSEKASGLARLLATLPNLDNKAGELADRLAGGFERLNTEMNTTSTIIGKVEDAADQLAAVNRQFSNGGPPLEPAASPKSSVTASEVGGQPAAAETASAVADAPKPFVPGPTLGVDSNVVSHGVDAQGATRQVALETQNLGS